MNMSASKSVNVAGNRSIFRVISVTDTSARLKDATGFEFDTLRVHAAVSDEAIVLQPGDLISAVIKIGSQHEITDIFFENRPIDFERKEFSSAGLETAVGWAPYNNPPRPGKGE